MLREPSLPPIERQLPGNAVLPPESLIPTTTQKTVPHHPEADCFPFPRFRDNLIIAQRDGTVEKGEFCMDCCYGVDDGSDPWEGKLEADDILRADVLGMAVGAKTGFVVVSCVFSVFQNPLLLFCYCFYFLLLAYCFRSLSR